MNRIEQIAEKIMNKEMSLNELDNRTRDELMVYIFGVEFMLSKEKGRLVEY